jgi:hypothetical protein
MKRKILFVPVFLFCGFTIVSAQSLSSNPGQDPIGNISVELTKISRSVQTLSERLKEFVDKWEKVGGLTLSEKQQKLIMGLEILVRTEQRVATLQKFQIDLVEKQGTTRARLAQVEHDMTPQAIDRSVVFEGTTKTDEIRESKRNALQAERSSLQILLVQINSNLADANDAVRESQSLVQRLRRTFLPQIERELADQ